jgi:PAS domain-containing protein
VDVSAALLTYRGRAYVLCSGRDVTIETQAQDALRDSARKLQAVARLAHLGYWEDDVVADRINWSEEAAHVISAPMTDRTRAWNEFMQYVHPEDRQYVEERRGRLLHGHEAGFRATFRLLAPDGGTRQVETIAEAVRDNDGRTVRTVGAIQDVSERRHVYELLRRDQDRFQLALQATGLGFGSGIETRTL